MGTRRLSAADALLIFIDDRNEVEGWLQLAGGAVTARGKGLEGLPGLADPNTGDALTVAAVVPGEAVALHWLEIPAGLAPAQAAAAARLVAAEVSLQPIADMHVAVGAEAGEGALRPVALVPALTMAGWLGKLQAHGLDPDLVLPEPLLLAPPAEGFARYHRGATPLYRGQADAFSIEPELADLVLADAPVTELPDEAFEGGLAAAVTNPVVNLRQGAFGKRRRWTVEWPLVRRLAALAVALLLVTLAIQVVQIFRYTFEADRLEAELSQVASAALPGISAANAPARLGERVTELRGGGYGALASSLFTAVRSTPGASLTAMSFDRDGALRATVQGDVLASIVQVQQQLEASGLSVMAGPLRSGGGRPTLELTVRGR
jgi:general secretion pathway protein L